MTTLDNAVGVGIASVGVEYGAFGFGGAGVESGISKSPLTI